MNENLNERIENLEKIVKKLYQFIRAIGNSGEHYSYGLFEDEKMEFAQGANDLDKEIQDLYQERSS